MMVIGLKRIMKGQSAGRGFTLIETLVCLVIISILTAISVVSYQGALDQADLKNALPALARQMEGLRLQARDRGSVITVTFTVGGTRYEVHERKGDVVYDSKAAGDARGPREIVDLTVIKRRLKFLRYEWPDGGDSPATFTFIASQEPQGGKLFMGTGNAEGSLFLSGGRVVYQLN